MYPEVANEFNSTPSRVERAIRHSIEVAFIRGNQKSISRVFSFRDNRRKPTNGEFIAMVADKIKLKKRSEALRLKKERRLQQKNLQK